MSRAVLIFARSPRAEAAAKRLDSRSGERLFAAVAKSWVRAAVAARAVVVIAGAPEHRPELTALIDGGVWIDQQGETFGERLASAAASVFALGADTLLVTGIDAPPPPHSIVRASFDAVEASRAAAVVAPSTDGGVNLIVLRREHVGLLRQFTVGARDLIARCRAHFGSDLVLLGRASDLDSADAFAAARRQACWRPYHHLLTNASGGTCGRGQAFTPALTSSESSLRAPPSVAH